MSPSLDNELAEPRQPASIELHSIDYVPDTERHGKVTHLGAIWFVSNINLTAMATGVTALSIGAGLVWTLIATILGSLFGTFFMAFHSAQGPQLGLPQLVQSRPQFGYLGAAVTVWVFALINYIAYNTSDALLSGDAFHELFGINTNVGYFIAALIAAVIALFGYHWIHRVNRVLTWPLIALMVTLSVAALKDGRLTAETWALGDFQPAPFMTVFVIVAGFQLGWAPYVSDYSRYLPASVGVRSTFWWTYLPSAVSGLWVFALGSIMYAAAGPDATPVEAFRSAADSLINGFGWVAVFALLLGLLSVMAINQYGGSTASTATSSSSWPTPSPRGPRSTWSTTSSSGGAITRSRRCSTPTGCTAAGGGAARRHTSARWSSWSRSWSLHPSPAASRPPWGTSITPCSSVCRSPP